MKTLQFFSDEYLARCRDLPPDAIVRFLEDFRIVHGSQRHMDSTPKDIWTPIQG